MWHHSLSTILAWILLFYLFHASVITVKQGSIKNDDIVNYNSDEIEDRDILNVISSPLSRELQVINKIPEDNQILLLGFLFYAELVT